MNNEDENQAQRSGSVDEPSWEFAAPLELRWTPSRTYELSPSQERWLAAELKREFGEGAIPEDFFRAKPGIVPVTHPAPTASHADPASCRPCNHHVLVPYPASTFKSDEKRSARWMPSLSSNPERKG